MVLLFDFGTSVGYPRDVPQTFATIDWSTGSLQAPGLRTSDKKLGQLKAVFHDQQSWKKMDPETVVYRVWWWETVPAGTEGGLFWGGTEIQPGRVGNEYFMTHGHRHAIVDRAEFYGTTVGQGMLVLRDASGKVWAEEMKPGSLHYIPGRVAHRVVNTGNVPLRFVACWPSDAGHDYEIASGKGLGARVYERDGQAVFEVTQD
jgi:glucose-6-phosphate isomerase